MVRWIALGCVLLLAACSDDTVAQPPELHDRTVTTAENTAVVVEVSVTAEDASAVALSIVTPPGHGTLTGNGPAWTYTPAPSYTGSDTFVVRGEDRFGRATATVTMNVTPVNDAPIANPDSFAGAFDTLLRIPQTAVLANDTDIDNATLTVTAVAATTHGVPVLDGSNILFTAETGFEGTATFEYTISDGTLSAHATVSITIGVDQAPVAVDDAVTTAEDTTLAIADATLLANDSDPDHQTIRIAQVGNASHGSVTHTGTQVAFVPEVDFHGIAGFDYTMTDGFKTDVGSVVVTVSSVNDAPVAVPDSAVTSEDTPLVLTSVALVANDSDRDGDPLTVSAVTPTFNTHGSVTLASGVVTYTPDADYNGAADFSYTVSDDNGGTASALVEITVGPVNDGPVAFDDTRIASEDTPDVFAATLLTANDTDIDGDALTVIAVTPSLTTHGTVSLDAGTITYMPAANYHGPADFDYTISDGTLTATASVQVTVTSVNDVPVAVVDALSTEEDTALEIGGGVLTANDTDADGDVLTVIAVAPTLTTHGTVSLTGGTITYTPAANYHGGADFDYTISDGNGGTASATVLVTVVSVNDVPAAVADALTTDEDVPLVVAGGVLTANDTDVDGDALNVTAVAETATTHGTVSLAAGMITYTPDANYHGGADFGYTISDGAGGTASATVSITVNAVNDAPVAVADALTTDEDTTLMVGGGALTANDTDVDGDALTVTAVAATGTTHGTVSLTAGAITYTPAANYHGLADFDYTISDDNGGTASGTVHVTVVSVNDPPVAVADALITDEDVALVIGGGVLTANDTDIDGDGLTVTAVATTATTHGTVSLAAGIITYTPDANYHGGADFGYTISDGAGGTASAAVSITVNAVNDVPVAVADALTTDEDTALVVGGGALTANDTDADGDTLTVTAVAATGTTHGTVGLDAGTITYTPAANYNGSADFAYTVSDGNGGTAIGSVVVTVVAVNDAPVVVATAGTANYLENATPVMVDTGIAVADLDSPSLVGATVQITTGCTSPQDVLALASPPSGIAVTGYVAPTCTLTLTGSASVASYQTALRAVTYANTSEVPSSTGRVVRFTVDDGAALNHTGSADRDLSVTPVDDAPVAVADSATVTEDSGANAIAVLDNDTDVDLGAKSISVVSQPVNGAVVITGGGTGLTYAPRANYCNRISVPAFAPAPPTDTFTYTLTPGGSTATVSVTVTCIDDPPVAVADSETVVEDSTGNVFDVRANDTDGDGGPKTVESVTPPSHGVATIGASGLSILYTPTAGYCNQGQNVPPDLFSYTLTPGGSSATVSVTVLCACGKNKPTDFVVGSN